MLLKSEIRSHCGLSMSYRRGEELLRTKSVQEMECKQTKRHVEVSAIVLGSRGSEYEVSLTLDPTEAHAIIEDYSCECLAFFTYNGMCKHCVALALAYRQQEIAQDQEARRQASAPAAPKQRTTSPRLSAVLSRYGAPSSNQLSVGIRRGTVHLELALHQHSYYNSDWQLSAQVGVKRMYVVKDMVGLVHGVLHGVDFAYGKNLRFVHAPEMFDAFSQKLLLILEQEVRTIYPHLDASSYYSSGTQYRSIRCSDEGMAQILELYSGQSIGLGGQSYPVVDGDPPVCLQLSPEGESGATLHIPSLTELTSAQNGYYLYGDTIYHVSPGFSRQALPFLRLTGAISRKDSPQDVTEYLSQADYCAFCGNILPQLQPFVEVQTGSLDLSAYQPQTPEFAFYLTQRDDLGLCLRPVVHYGSAEYPLLVDDGHSYRRPELEEPAQALVRTYFLPSMDEALWHIFTDEGVYQFLKDGLDALRQAGEVYIDDALRNLRIRQPSTAHVGVSLAGGLLDVSMEVEDLPPEELSRLLQAYSVKKKYYRLRSGEFLSLEEGSLAVLSELSQALGMQGKAHAQVPAFRAQYVNSLLTEEDAGIELRRSTDFKRLIRELRDYRDSDYPVPEALQASLRGYQKTGYRWLCTLAACGLGGILADDMGLGKTIQTISLLLQLNGTALVVCPASLLYNWQAELRRFAPTLQVQLISGTAAVRKKQLEAAADVYVTSYDLLRRDVALYGEKHFGCCILDEAQYIRNPVTKAAKAVKAIQADHRFALTGTPISNRLSDLWSIFDFLMPGYLYSYPQFKEQLETPISEGDPAALARLQRMTAPFLLRRKKEDVLRELPEKIVTVRYVEMTDEQRLLYRAQEQQLRQQLEQTSEEDLNKDRIQVLAALTRLRQLCCTPELYLEGYHGGSGKVDACMELLEEARQSEHRTLVFSQFTTMLEALFAEAKRRGLRCLYLSGQNTKEQRRDMVEAFQAGSYDVFFLSLKAGGTGLNLTAADHVIHFDPWWNAAAEDQATDRAHRIGQDKTVFVTKLVARQSIEERIVALQEAKRELSDQVISGAAALDGHITREALLELLTEAG